MDTKQQQPHTRPEIAQGFHDAATAVIKAGKAHDAVRAASIVGLAFMLTGVAMRLGYLTQAQVDASAAIGKRESQDNLDAFRAGRAITDTYFEPFMRHFERLAAFIDAAGPTDTVPPITVVSEPVPVPAFSPEEQFVAQRAFAGPQPHRFTREVM